MTQGRRSDIRELRAIESARDALINRIYYLRLLEMRRPLTGPERLELERLDAQYRAGSNG